MPGVGSYKDKIFVVGGTDDSWTAQSSVEMFDTLSMEWLKLPDLLVSALFHCLWFIEGLRIKNSLKSCSISIQIKL